MYYEIRADDKCTWFRWKGDVTEHVGDLLRNNAKRIEINVQEGDWPFGETKRISDGYHRVPIGTVE